MDRRAFIKKAGVAGTAAVASAVFTGPAAAQEAGESAGGSQAPAAPAVIQAAPKFSWRLSSGFPQRLETLYGAAQVFADSVREMTDGNLDIEVFPPGVIVDVADGLDAVQNGTIEIAHTASNYFWEKDPTFAFGTGVPFGLNQRMTNAWLHEGGGLELLNAFYGKYGIIGFPAGNTGSQMGGWFRREINRLQDMDGLLFRVGGFGGRILAQIGVVPRDMPADDIYQALDEGTIDAAEFVGPYDDAKLGLNQVAKYYYYPGWWESGVAAMNLVNLDKWNALPRSYQEAIRTGSALANTVMIARYDVLNPPALVRLVEAGTVLRPYSREILIACFDAAEKTYADLAADNEDFRTVLDSYMGYRRNAYLWFQIAEHSQDTFLMLQQRAGRL